MGGKYDLSASTVLVDPATDLERWRLLDEKGRQTWHYLRTDEEVKNWPQTVVDRHHLGLPQVCNIDCLYILLKGIGFTYISQTFKSF
jgi:hypothetical protein